MEEITIVDARMGRGKSSAAIQYMNRHKDAKRFLYVTAYLNEVDRICEQCDFEQPDSDTYSKSASLKMMLRKGHNIAATHALFSLLDDEALEIISDRKYSLIVDESFDVIRKVMITASDMDIVLNTLTARNANGSLRWVAEDYDGTLNTYRDILKNRSIFQMDTSLISVMSPRILKVFEDVFMLTYLFNGQYAKAYLEIFKIPYHIIGVQQTGGGYVFSDQEDKPPPLDYKSLIHIYNGPKMNDIGDGRNSLSKNWYARRGYSHEDMRTLRNNLRNYFNRINHTSAEQRLWTCFKDDARKLVDKKTGRFKNDFLQIGARATNAYRECDCLAYLSNRFIDPNMKKFCYIRGGAVDEDQFALSEMLQWIWRSAIRDDKPIDLYIPSSRMRKLLTDWMEKTAEGGEA